LPRFIDLYELHRDHRDRFEIIAFHDRTAKSFAELDPKLVDTRAKLWRGKDLPFPILLDATGQTVKAYGIDFFPTTLLIDPDGKLVGHADAADLEKHLPPVPTADRVSRALDRVLSLAFTPVGIADACAFLSRVARIEIRFPKEERERLHIKPDTLVPLQLAGTLTLAAWLDLALEPLGLTYEPDERGLLIVARKPGQTRQETEFQRLTAKRLEQVLDKKVTFQFSKKSLQSVAEHFQGETDENFLLDPSARKCGRLNPETVLSGSGRGVPLRVALHQLLDPAGLSFEIRDELIMIVPKDRAASK
jgi:hypothetical protein